MRGKRDCFLYPYYTMYHIHILWKKCNIIGKHFLPIRDIEGVSFRYGNIAFKDSQIDRKFSFENLQKEFDRNILEARKRGREEYLQKQTGQNTRKKLKQNLKNCQLLV